MKTIKDLKTGEFFTLKPIAEPKDSQVLIREGYDRTSRKYCAVCFSDCNRERQFKGDTVVYTDFVF